jgi:pilus assembly protein CpaF
MVTLLLTEKGGETKQLNFDKDEVTVGRVQGNDIVLPKGNVSKRHCRIVFQGGKVLVEDLKSTNGTYINGRKIAEETSVSGADKIYVGDFVIRLDLPEAAAAAAPPAAAEAGSLSTALPRRPPPPPAPGRATTMMPAAADAPLPGELRARARTTAPPPPPSPRKDPGASSGVSGVEINTMPPEPAVAEMPSLSEPDEEILPARPRLTVPPLKSPRPLISPPEEAREARNEARNEARHEARNEEPPARDRLAGAPRQPETAPPEGLAAWLQNLVVAEGATAVFVSGGRVEIERNGERASADAPANANSANLAEAVRSLAARGTPRPSGDTRVVNVLLPENARLAAIFPPVAGELCATIEKVAPAGRTLTQLNAAGAISREGQEVIEVAVTGRRNILVGGDGRALEALLQAVAAAVPERMRVVTIAEVTPPSPTAGWIKLQRDTHVSDVVRAAASLRPDYLIVDVNNPGLATDVLGQSVLGQEGAIVAVAARSGGDALGRLAGLAGPALGGVAHARELAASAFDLVLCAATLADGSVRVLEIGEPAASIGGPPEIETAIVWQPRGGGEGQFEIVGGLSRLSATLAARGLELPPALKR